jgi:hypothetical protein
VGNQLGGVPIVMLAAAEANLVLEEIEQQITDLRAAIDESWRYL